VVPSAAGVTLPLLVQDRRSPQAARLPPHSRRPLRVRCMRRGMAGHYLGSPPLRGARWSPASTTADEALLGVDKAWCTRGDRFGMISISVCMRDSEDSN